MSPEERPPVGRVLGRAALAALVPIRDAAGHKGTFGSLLAVAGSIDYLGAGLLAGAAALRAGAGLVTLALPASLQPLVAGRVPELVTLALPEAAPGEVDASTAAAVLLERPADALLAGPGLRPGRGTASLVVRLLAGGGPPGDAAAPAPIVLDAEALNQLAKRDGWWRARGRPGIVTPHPGEFERLTGSRPRDADERVRQASDAARRWGLVVVLKGAGTVVAGPDGDVVVAPFRLPALATAGSGDILAGVCGSLLAQGMAPFEAACLAVHLHGMAGARVAERLGDAGLLASDLLPEIPRARRELTLERDRGGSGRVGFGRPAREV